MVIINFHRCIKALSRYDEIHLFQEYFDDLESVFLIHFAVDTQYIMGTNGVCDKSSECG